MAQALRDVEGRELHMAEGYSLEDGVLLVDGAPLFMFDDPWRLSPRLLDAIARSMPEAVLDRRSPVGRGSDVS